MNIHIFLNISANMTFLGYLCLLLVVWLKAPLRCDICYYRYI